MPKYPLTSLSPLPVGSLEVAVSLPELQLHRAGFLSEGPTFELRDTTSSLCLQPIE